MRYSDRSAPVSLFHIDRRPHSPRGAVFSFSTNENGRGRPETHAEPAARQRGCPDTAPPTHTNAAAILRPHPPCHLAPAAPDHPSTPSPRTGCNRPPHRPNIRTHPPAPLHTQKGPPEERSCRKSSPRGRLYVSAGPKAAAANRSELHAKHQMLMSSISK